MNMETLIGCGDAHTETGGKDRVAVEARDVGREPGVGQCAGGKIRSVCVI